MRKYLIILLSACIITFVNGQDFPKPMVPTRIVNDFTGLLNQQEQMSLENKLVEFNKETSTQVAVVTYDDLQGFDIADYGNRLGQEWGIGQQGKDNGILVLVSPANRKVTIQTGYGLEGAVPDGCVGEGYGAVIADRAGAQAHRVHSSGGALTARRSASRRVST